MIGFVPASGPLHRAHPFTSLSIGGAVAVLSFSLPEPGIVALAGIAIVFVFVEGVPGVLKLSLVLAFPFWFFLFLIHAVFADNPERAIVLGSRVTAMIVAFLTVMTAVHPARLVEALVARRVPFSVAFLFAATLQAVPRLQERAQAILEAQRCRGLRLTGSPIRKIRAIIPLVVPLVMSSLAEVDERGFALETRAATSRAVRTPIDPPADSRGERFFRWSLFVAVIVTVVGKAIWWR